MRRLKVFCDVLCKLKIRFVDFMCKWFCDISREERSPIVKKA